MNILNKQILLFFLIAFFSLAHTVNAQDYSTTSRNMVTVAAPSEAILLKVSIKNGAELKVGDKVREGDFLALIVDKDHNKITVTSGVSGEISYINKDIYKKFTPLPAGIASS